MRIENQDTETQHIVSMLNLTMKSRRQEEKKEGRFFRASGLEDAKTFVFLSQNGAEKIQFVIMKFVILSQCRKKVIKATES